MSMQIQMPYLHDNWLPKESYSPPLMVRQKQIKKLIDLYYLPRFIKLVITGGSFFQTCLVNREKSEHVAPSLPGVRRGN